MDARIRPSPFGVRLEVMWRRGRPIEFDTVVVFNFLQIAQHAILDQLANFLVGGKEPARLVDGQFDTIFLRQRNQFARFVDRFGERFFAQNVLAVFQAPFGDWEMRSRWSGDDDPVDFVQQFAIVGDVDRSTKLFAHRFATFFVGFGQCDPVSASCVRRQIRQVINFGDSSASDDAKANIIGLAHEAALDKTSDFAR